MKKRKLINSEISYVVSKMGHTDMLTIADCGLPIDDSVKRIDLALTHNIPTLLQTLEVVLSELCVEEVVLAKELISENRELYTEVLKRFKKVKVTEVSHEDFKELTKRSKAVIRTGECTPYANIILKSGVVF